MGSSPDPPAARRLSESTILPTAVAVSASAIALFLGTGLHPIWWLTWLGPLPILLIAPRLSAARAFVVATSAWLIGSLNMFHYLHSIVHAPIAIVLPFLIIPACAFGLAVISFRAWIRQRALWRAALIFPTMWVSYEYLNAVTSPHSTFGNLGYT